MVTRNRTLSCFVSALSLDVESGYYKRRRRQTCTSTNSNDRTQTDVDADETECSKSPCAVCCVLCVCTILQQCRYETKTKTSCYPCCTLRCCAYEASECIRLPMSSEWKMVNCEWNGIENKRLALGLWFVCMGARVYESYTLHIHSFSLSLNNSNSKFYRLSRFHSFIQFRLATVRGMIIILSKCPIIALSHWK